MKHSLKFIVSIFTILVLIVSFTISTFADRVLFIRDLPKQGDGYGVGA